MPATTGSLRSLIFAVTQIGRYAGVEKKVEKLLLHMGFPQMMDTFLGFPTTRTVVLWGLYWGSSI